MAQFWREQVSALELKRSNCSSAVGETPDRWILTILIGVCGAITLSDIYRQWWKDARLKSAIYAAITAGGWFLVGSGHNLLSHMISTLTIGAVITLLTAVLTFVSRPPTDRRFELTTLKRVLPFFALYILRLSGILSVRLRHGMGC